MIEGFECGALLGRTKHDSKSAKVVLRWELGNGNGNCGGE